MNLIYSCAETGQVWQARKICICLAQLNRFQDHNSSTSRFSILKALTDQTYKHQHWSSNTGSVQTELFISVYHAPQHPRFLVLLCNFNSIFNINFKGNVQNIHTLLSSTLLFELLQLLCLWPLTFSTSQFLGQHYCFLAHRKSSIASVFPSCSIKYILLQK